MVGSIWSSPRPKDRDVDNELRDVCCSIAARLGWHLHDVYPAIVRRGADGMTHVVYLHLAPVGPPPQRGIPDREWLPTFAVTLGARAHDFTRDSSAFPAELDLDVSEDISALLRPYRELHWTLDEPQLAVDQIVDLINGTGSRWFAKFKSVERTLKTLETVPPEVSSWRGPRMIAMRIRAQRGELADAQRDLTEHLDQRGGQLRQNQVAYGVVLARAAEYGLTLPENSDGPVRLGITWQARCGVEHDRYGNEIVDTRDFPAYANLDQKTLQTVLRFRDEARVIESSFRPDITREVAAFLQSGIRKELETDWPSCPEHESACTARVSESTAVWWCEGSSHVVSAVGALQSVLDRD